MSPRLKRAGQWGGAIAIGTLALGFLGKSVKTLPPDTRVVYDIEARLYATIPCIQSGMTEHTYTLNIRSSGALTLFPTSDYVSLADARRLAKSQGGRADKACRNAGGFATEQSLLAAFLEKAGF